MNKIRYHKYRFDYNFAHLVKHKIPVDIMLELSSHCNMKCSYCYHAAPNSLPFKTLHMPFDMATKIVSQAAEYGVRSLKFNYRGEGTLNPNYLQITSLARSLRGGSTFIDLLCNSNFKFGSNRDDIFEGLANLTKVKVSYDSFTPHVFEEQRRGGNHELTTRNIDIFYNHRQRIKNETELVIQAVRSHLNQNEDIEAISKKRWPEASVSIRDMVGGRVEGVIELKKRDYSERIPCRQAFARIIFASSGRAFPCCPDIAEQLNIGDINEKNIFEIFNSDKAVKLREDLKSGEAFKKDPCKNCSSFETFKGYRPKWNS